MPPMYTYTVFLLSTIIHQQTSLAFSIPSVDTRPNSLDLQSRADNSSQTTNQQTVPQSRPSSPPLVVIITSALIAVVLSIALVMYFCWWRPGQHRRWRADPVFDILYSERSKSYDSDKYFVQIEQDLAGSRPTTPAQQYERLEANRQESVYELDGVATECVAPRRETESNTWTGGIKRLSQMIVGSRWSTSGSENEHSPSTKRTSEQSGWDNSPIPTVKLAPPKVSEMEMSLLESSSLGRRSPSPGMLDERVGRHHLRHEHRTVSRDATLSPARSITSKWNSLRVPISPVGSCEGEARAVACRCPAHVATS